jgi:hypothetical protein
MILRKYGATVHSVVPHFDSRALNEISFQKDERVSMPWPEFAEKYQPVSRHELVARAEGDVQQEAEEKVLTELRHQLEGLEVRLQTGQVLFIESEPGKDYPKMREKQQTIVVGMVNRLHFERTVDPPLRVAVYAARQS